jgi:PAS domain S-box-containing protein
MKNTTRILVVDDEPAVLQVLSAILRSAGYEVWEAANGQQGLQLARERRPDLVLLDVLLPDLSGIDVCRQIKADVALLDVFVVLISGTAISAADKVDGAEIGADDYLVKPVNPDEFLARIRTTMRLRDTTAALRASEQRFRQLTEYITEVFWMSNPDKTQLNYISPGYEKVWGRTCESLYRSPLVWLEAVHPQDRDRVLQAALTKQIAGEYDEEYRIMRPDGSLRWIRDRAFPIRDETGTVYRIAGIAEDITERKQAEKMLRLLRYSVDEASETIACIDREARFVLVNDTFCRLTGYSREELLSKTVHDIDPNFPAETWPGYWERLKRSGSLRLESCHRTTDGRVYPVEILSTYFEYEGREYQTGCARDITERKRAEEALREAEARYRTIFENADEGIFQTTPDGHLVTANPALARMFGYESPEEMISSVTDIERQIYVSPERRRELKRILDTEGSVQGFEAENCRKDGNRIWIRINAYAVRDASGAILNYQGTTQDVTERKWSENLLQTQRDFGVFLSSTNDLKAALERLLAIALQNSGVDCGVVHLVDPKTGALDIAVQHGLSARFAESASHFSAHLDQGRLPDAGPGIFQPHGKPLAGIVRQLKREGLRVMEIIPTQYNGRVVAVMSLGSRSCREIPARSRQAIESIVTQAGGAITRIWAEKSLHTNRQLLEKTLNNLHDAVFLLDARTGMVQECNSAAAHIFGYTRDEMVGRIPDFSHPIETLLHQLNQQLPSRNQEKEFEGEFELRMKRKNGTEFPTEHRLTAIRDEAGRLVSWVNVVRDISERKRVEEELRQLPQRIIEAQEAERLRVARELHDGVNQIIASAKMRLLKVQDNLAALSPAAREILTRCGQLLNQALEENRRIAHNLRPSDLDELGLAAACRNLCKEMQSRANLVMKSSIKGLSQRLPPQMELNLFRILQEALNNIEKHARAKNVFVEIVGRSDLIVLKIQDDGRGFAPQKGKTSKRKRSGIGLTNMRERAAFLGGTCEIENVPKRGTTITVRVPSSKSD